MNERASDSEVAPSKTHQAPEQEQDADGLRGVNVRDVSEEDDLLSRQGAHCSP